MARIVLGLRGYAGADIEEDVFRDLGTVVTTTAADPAAFMEDVEDATVLLNPPYPTPAELIEAFDSLEVIAIYGIGTDHVDLDAATEHGVQVINVPDAYVEDVSSHALALMLAASRRLLQYDRQVKNGGWDWSGVGEIHRVQSETLGLVGFGHIPRRFTEKIGAFDPEILTYDPYVDAETARGYGVESVGFEDLLDRSTVVSLHAPLTPETRDILDRDAFQRLDSDALIVNTARGALIDEDALLAALENDEIRGAALDVLREEPPTESHPLVDRDDIILTPHAGWYTVEAKREARETAARDARRVLEGEKPINPVNEV